MHGQRFLIIWSSNKPKTTLIAYSSKSSCVISRKGSEMNLKHVTISQIIKMFVNIYRIKY